jgi:hypothetical protein
MTGSASRQRLAGAWALSPESPIEAFEVTLEAAPAAGNNINKDGASDINPIIIDDD